MPGATSRSAARANKEKSSRRTCRRSDPSALRDRVNVAERHHRPRARRSTIRMLPRSPCPQLYWDRRGAARSAQPRIFPKEKSRVPHSPATPPTSRIEPVRASASVSSAATLLFTKGSSSAASSCSAVRTTSPRLLGAAEPEVKPVNLLSRSSRPRRSDLPGRRGARRSAGHRGWRHQRAPTGTPLTIE